MSDELRDILEKNILEVAELEHAPPDIQEQILADARTTILREVIRHIESRLSSEEKTEFVRLFASENDMITDTDVAFLQKYAPDFSELVLQETLAFKKGVMDAMQEMDKKSADEKEKINGILNGFKE